MTKVGPGDPSAQDGLGRAAARGAVVTLGAQGCKIVVQLTSVLLLARLLTPGEYGLVAMVMVLVGLGEVLRDFGLSAAAVQAKSLTVAQRDNLFWVNTSIGVLLAVVLALVGAPLLRLIYDEPRVLGLAQVLGLVFVLNGLTTQFRASLVRDLRFSRIAVADVVAPMIALASSVVAAVFGAGYWALVAQQLTQGAVLLLILAGSARWLPRWYRRGVEMRGLLTFGANLVASQLVNYASNNVDNFVVGVRFGSSALGLYSRAFQLLMTPLNQVRTPLTTVALPIMSRINDDHDRFNRFVVASQLALGYSIAPVLGVVIGASQPLTQVLLGSRWSDAAPLLSLLAAAGVFQLLPFVGYWIYVSRGLTKDLLRYTLVTSVIKITCILVGSLGGIVGVAVGYAMAPAISWPISLWWLSRRTVIPVRALYAGAARILAMVGLTALLTSAIARAGAELPDAVTVVLTLAAAATTYVIITVLVAPIRRDLRMVFGFARLVRSRSTDARV